MTTLIIRDNSPEAKKFIEFAKTLPFVEVSTSDDIPGLPYTREERITAIRETEVDYERGVPGIFHEEVAEKMLKKRKTAKFPCQHTDEEILTSCENAMEAYEKGELIPHEQIRKKHSV